MTSISPITTWRADPPGPELPSARVGASAPAGAPSQAGFSATLRTAGFAAARAAEARSVGEAFEATTLTTFVQHMLPPEDSAVWGGRAGAMWRSVFAQNLAEDVARGGGIGIAEIINTMLAEQEGTRS